MAISSQNPLLFGFSGRIGNIVIKQYKDKTVISAVPDMEGRKLSSRQKAANKLMRDANIHARHIMASAKLKAEACRRLEVTPNKLYRALVKDFLQKKAKVAI
jgi:hypothetical protein